MLSLGINNNNDNNNMQHDIYSAVIVTTRSLPEFTPLGPRPKFFAFGLDLGDCGLGLQLHPTSTRSQIMNYYEQIINRKNK